MEPANPAPTNPPKRQKVDSPPGSQELRKLAKSVQQILLNFRPLATAHKITLHSDRIVVEWDTVATRRLQELVSKFLGPWYCECNILSLNSLCWTAIESAIRHFPELLPKLRDALEVIRLTAGQYAAMLLQDTQWPRSDAKHKFLLPGTIFITEQPLAEPDADAGVVVHQPDAGWVDSLMQLAARRYPRPNEQAATIYYSTWLASTFLVSGSKKTGDREFNYADFSMDPTDVRESWAVYYRPAFGKGVLMTQAGAVLVFFTEPVASELVEAEQRLPPIIAVVSWFGVQCAANSAIVVGLRHKLTALNMAAGTWAPGRGELHTLWRRLYAGQ